MLVRSDQTSILPQASSNQDSWVPYSFFFTLSYVTYSVSIYHMSDGAVSFASKYQQKVGLMLCSNYNEDCRRHYKSMQLLRDTKRPRLSCNHHLTILF